VIPQGPTFESIECRFDDLRDGFGELDGVTPRAAALRDRLGKANGLERNARAFCANGDAKHAKKSLKSTFRKLGRVRALLGGKKLRSVPGRDVLLATVDGLRSDVRAFPGALSCPADTQTTAAR
jgi:hypothetical protein